MLLGKLEKLGLLRLKENNEKMINTEVAGLRNAAKSTHITQYKINCASAEPR